MLGKKFGPCSEERRRNISLAKKGKSPKRWARTPEHIQKIIEHNKRLGLKKKGQTRPINSVVKGMKTVLNKKRQRLENVIVRFDKLKAIPNG